MLRIVSNSPAPARSLPVSGKPRLVRACRQAGPAPEPGVLLIGPAGASRVVAVTGNVGIAMETAKFARDHGIAPSAVRVAIPA